MKCLLIFLYSNLLVLLVFTTLRVSTLLHPTVPTSIRLLFFFLKKNSIYVPRKLFLSFHSFLRAFYIILNARLTNLDWDASAQLENEQPSSCTKKKAKMKKIYLRRHKIYSDLSLVVSKLSRLGLFCKKEAV